MAKGNIVSCDDGGVRIKFVSGESSVTIQFSWTDAMELVGNINMCLFEMSKQDSFSILKRRKKGSDT